MVVSPPVIRDASAILAEYAAEFEAFPPEAIYAARLDVLDTLGCAIGGLRSSSTPPLTALAIEWGGAPISALWGAGTRVPPPEAAFVNGTTAHALDYDDTHDDGVLHPGVTVIPAVAAMADAGNLDNMEAFLRAVTVGVDVACRIALAVDEGPGRTGWLLTPLCGYFGAAAAASRIMGLDAANTRQAIGLAYSQTSGTGQPTLDGALAKRMQAGFAARGGTFAAVLASRGLTGALDSLEGQRGFFHVYHQDRYERQRMLDGLGERFEVAEISFKPYPVCRWTHAAYECALELRRQGVFPENLESVEVGVSAQAYRSTGQPTPRRFEPQTVVDAQFSIPYVFAVGLTQGNIGLTDFTEEAVLRPEMRRVAARVQCHVDPELDRELGRGTSPARARATTTDGNQVRAEVLRPLGSPDSKLREPELAVKFFDCCEFGGLPRDRAERLADIILHATDSGYQELSALLQAGVSGND